jgi:Fe-S cluster assembly protein SufD
MKTLKNDWTELLDPKDPLLNLRKKCWDRFEAIGLPRPKQEDFQYLTKQPPFPRFAHRKNIASKMDAEIVFIDGFLAESFSPIPSQLVCLSLEKAIRSYGLFLQNRYTQTLSRETDPYAALNGAAQGGGAFLYIPPKCKATLHVEQIYTSAEMSTSRLHVYLGKNAELELTQKSQGASGLSNNMIDVVLDSNAQFSFFDYAEGHYQAVRANLKRDAQLKALFLGNTLRNSLKIELTEEGSEAELYGLSQLEKEAEAHFHVLIEHVAPHTHSRQHFKSVLRDQSRFSFEGKIYVHPEAQKTEAYQLNNNLLLSDEASANAKPNLEIFADDVKASHGATVGQLDAEALFYLRSRGLSLAQAREWLIQGFCKEILDHAR